MMMKCFCLSYSEKGETNITDVVLHQFSCKAHVTVTLHTFKKKIKLLPCKFQYLFHCHLRVLGTEPLLHVQGLITQ